MSMIRKDLFEIVGIHRLILNTEIPSGLGYNDVEAFEDPA